MRLPKILGDMSGTWYVWSEECSWGCQIA